MNIHIDFPEYYSVEAIQKDIKPFLINGIQVEYKIKEMRVFAALEWTIPTAIVVYILKPYFDAFLKEAGKQHFDVLSKSLKSLINKGKEMNVKLITSSETPEKLSKNYNQSLAISVLFETKKGKIIKLLFDNDLEKEDWDYAIDQMMEYVVENYENESTSKLCDVIKDFNKERAYKIYAIIDKKTKLLNIYDDKEFIKYNREK
ncbi:MAG TPA: hypothetical protein PLL09_15695 [Flavobacterium sp.]|uniref:hypothetical protein n=1 Tax=unclassified Flavobacterium TaxID=196869 RepID=UPI0025BDF83A|nr:MULTISPECIES: hypothetical protein [unclassified Flavobacterium]HRE79260.1 hypothetical protein [Flavobacterium sp.]